jgi:hypothetical protein
VVAVFVSFQALPICLPNFLIEHDVVNLVVNLATQIPTHLQVVFVSVSLTFFVFLVQVSTSREVLAQCVQDDSVSPVHVVLALAHAGSELAEMAVFVLE